MSSQPRSCLRVNRCRNSPRRLSSRPCTLPSPAASSSRLPAAECPARPVCPPRCRIGSEDKRNTTQVLADVHVALSALFDFVSVNNSPACYPQWLTEKVVAVVASSWPAPSVCRLRHWPVAHPVNTSMSIWQQSSACPPFDYVPSFLPLELSTLAGLGLGRLGIRVGPVASLSSALPGLGGVLKTSRDSAASAAPAVSPPPESDHLVRLHDFVDDKAACT